MSKGPVILDPAELRRFAINLDHFNDELDNNSSRLEAQFTRLGETWRDPQYMKFADEFSQIMANLRRFRKTCEEVIPRLHKTAERADNVHT